MTTIIFDESAFGGLTEQEISYLSGKSPHTYTIFIDAYINKNKVNFNFTHDKDYHKNRESFIHSYYTLLNTPIKSIQLVFPQYAHIYDSFADILKSGDDILYFRPPFNIAKNEYDIIQPILEKLIIDFPKSHIGIINTRCLGSTYGRKIIQCLRFIEKNTPLFSDLYKFVNKFNYEYCQYFYVNDLSRTIDIQIFDKINRVLFEDRVASGYIGRDYAAITSIQRRHNKHAYYNQNQALIQLATDIVGAFHNLGGSEITIEYALNDSDADDLAYLIYKQDKTIPVKKGACLDPITATYLGVNSILATIT